MITLGTIRSDGIGTGTIRKKHLEGYVRRE
jgi:hypothetical protein